MLQKDLSDGDSDAAEGPSPLAMWEVKAAEEPAAVVARGDRGQCEAAIMIIEQVRGGRPERLWDNDCSAVRASAALDGVAAGGKDLSSSEARRPRRSTDAHVPSLYWS